jgi:hypothetical protein
VIAQTKFVGLPRHFAWQNTEFAIAGMIKSLREMAGRDFRPTRVTFTLARNSELPEFERFFGCPVEFSASADQMDFSIGKTPMQTFLDATPLAKEKMIAA